MEVSNDFHFFIWLNLMTLPQGGILSPLLANINLNEFDHWIEGQWAKQDFPNIAFQTNRNGTRDFRNEVHYMKKVQSSSPCT